ncbi:MAG: hypothetical protein EOP83_37205, partial [Verrucomicrobiaceae bacterium]
MNRLLKCLTLLLLCAGTLNLRAEEPVTLQEDDSSYTLANGLVTARISKRSGDLISLQYREQELLGAGSGKAFGYWSNVGGGTLGSKRESVIVADPSSNEGARAIVSVKCSYDGERRSLPADVDMRYALGHGDEHI